MGRQILSVIQDESGIAQCGFVYDDATLLVTHIGVLNESSRRISVRLGTARERSVEQSREEFDEDVSARLIFAERVTARDGSEFLNLPVEFHARTGGG